MKSKKLNLPKLQDEYVIHADYSYSRIGEKPKRSQSKRKPLA